MAAPLASVRNPLDHDRHHSGPSVPLAPHDAFAKEVHHGLRQPQPSVPPRWFYDDEGSQLFEQLTHAPEYYPTRTERAILAAHAPAIAQEVASHPIVVEYGAGALSKTPLLLEAVKPQAYVPVDIAGDFLRASAQALAERFPGLPIHPLEADFGHPIVLPQALQGPRLGFFPGSTLGNLAPPDAIALLQRMGHTLGAHAQLLVGLDRVKSPALLVPAYADAQGLTAQFNRNLLVRINRELAGTIPVDAFVHHVRWNHEHARIEMHLEATQDVAFTVQGEGYRLNAGQTIHTENSHKYTPEHAEAVLAHGGWRVTHQWSDAQGWFTLYLADRRG